MAEKNRSQWIIRGVIVLLAVVVGVTLYEFETYRSRLPPPPNWPETKEIGMTKPFGEVSLILPTWVGQPPGVTDRVWGAESPGKLWSFLADGSSTEKQLELDLTDRVEQGGELGFYGVAFHPGYATNRTIFASYTSKVGGTLHSRISRFVGTADGKFDPASEEILIRLDQPFETHNGGAVMFGPDGYLYISFGDGGMAGDPHDHAQDPHELYGKVLRVVAGPTGDLGIPPDNPFADGKAGAPEVYALGLRNPWRMAFDPANGELWLGDVGQDAYEEINFVEKGKNYGWPIFEGFGCYDPPIYFKVFGWGQCDDTDARFTKPVVDYSHGGDDVSVTGGVVYRGGQLPQIEGDYLYGDFASGKIWAWSKEKKSERLLLDTPFIISTFWQLADGRAGIVDYATGRIWMFDKPKDQR